MLKLWRISLFSIVMLLALLWQAGSASASAGWVVVPSVNPPGDDTLFAIAATSTKDAWAVGSTNQGSAAPGTLAEHWNGSTWSVVPSPNPGPTFNKLLGVTALSSSNAWAVGYYQNSSGGVSTLIEHWNGTQWSVVISPNPVGMMINQLWGVSAASANDIWAIGTSQINNVTQTLTEHWNGTAWSIVPSSNPGASFSFLRGVVTVSATSAWAVGNYINQQGASQTLTEHWNGTQWSVVPSANPASDNYLFGVTAVPGSSQLWAVGEYTNGNGGQPLTEKWNGTSWSVVSSPTIQTNGNFLDSVSATSVNNIWAVGQAGMSTGIVSRGAESANSSPQEKTLILHWNGTRWSIASSPNPSVSNGLNGVACVPGTTQVWAAGAYNNGSRPVYTLIEYHQ